MPTDKPEPVAPPMWPPPLPYAGEVWERNMRSDANYAPYCLRAGCGRMQRLTPTLAVCQNCGNRAELAGNVPTFPPGPVPPEPDRPPTWPPGVPDGGGR